MVREFLAVIFVNVGWVLVAPCQLPHGTAHTSLTSALPRCLLRRLVLCREGCCWRSYRSGRSGTAGTESGDRLGRSYVAVEMCSRKRACWVHGAMLCDEARENQAAVDVDDHSVTLRKLRASNLTPRSPWTYILVDEYYEQ